MCASFINSCYPCLLPPDQNLEAHGSHALTSIVASGTATIGRSFGHSLRRAVSVRHSSASRYSREGRPSSLLSTNSAHRHSGSAIAEETSTFVDLRPRSMGAQDFEGSNRSSVVSMSSVSTISSINAPETPHANGPAYSKPRVDPKPYNLSSVQRSGAESPILVLPPAGQRSGAESPLPPGHRPFSSSSSGSSLHAGGRSPQLGSPQSLRAVGRSPQPPGSPHARSRSPQPSSPLGRRSPQPSPPLQQDNSSSSSLDSLEKTVQMYNTPV